MLYYLKEKKILVPSMIAILIVIIGIFVSLALMSKRDKIKSQINEQFRILNLYLSQGRKMPSIQRIKELKEYKGFLNEQTDFFMEKLKKQGNLSEEYKDCKTPLEFRELITKSKERFTRDDIGFVEYIRNVPLMEELPVLKRQLAFIAKILESSETAKIQTVSIIERLKPKIIKSGNSDFFKEYPCLFYINCRTKNLIPFLYNICAKKELFIVKGIRIKSKIGEYLDVILKISYVEKI